MTDGPGLLRYEAAGGIVRLTMDRPEKRNALNRALIRDLMAAFDRAEADADARVVTLAGAGPDFCAGADLAELAAAVDAGAVANLADVDLLAHLFLRIRRLRLPVIARVHGRALGGGCGLATACDLVLAHEAASFGYPEVRIGFVPAMVMAMLRRNVSEKRAFEMISLGETYPAAAAERMGLVNRVYPADRFDDECDTFAAELATRAGSAIELGKRLLYHQDGMSFAAALEAGVEMNVIARMTDATRDGVARFLDRSHE